MACESEIVQPPRQILARKPRYPTGKPRVVGRPRIERCADLGILPATEKQPAMERRNEAPVVGYLGFRAEFFPNRCTDYAGERLRACRGGRKHRHHARRAFRDGCTAQSAPPSYQPPTRGRYLVSRCSSNPHRETSYNAASPFLAAQESPVQRNP